MKYAPFILMLSLLLSCSEKEDIPVVTVKNEILNPVNPHLFGQFMEKCSWGGEIGGDLLINPKTGKFDSLILDQLKSLNIPNIRFPGGSDVDYFPWTDMIDHAPGKKERKPYRAYRQGDGQEIVSDNRLGVNEFLDLCEILDSEPLMVLNIGDAYHKNQTIEEAKSMAAGLLVYCNFDKAETGPDWPSFRKQNGRESPWDVRYFEIGNEYWGFEGFNWKQPPFDNEDVTHLFNCIKAIADTLLAMDPEIKIIVDGPIPELNQMFEEHMKDQIDFIVIHPYLPWGVSEIYNQQGEEVNYDTLQFEHVWNALVSTPVIDSATGLARLFDDHWTLTGRSTIFDVACTEWNWNGWFTGNAGKADLSLPAMAQGIGAAGFLHSFMREGDKIKMASQSMLAGQSWGITGIRIDPEYNQASVLLPTAQVTGLYSKHHGSQLLVTETDGVPEFSQPLQMNGIKPSKGVPAVEILATKNEKSLYLHVINRDSKEPYHVKMKSEDFNLSDDFTRYSLTGDIKAEISGENLKQIGKIQSTAFSSANENIILKIPAASVNVFKFSFTVQE